MSSSTTIRDVRRAWCRAAKVVLAADEKDAERCVNEYFEEHLRTEARVNATRYGYRDFDSLMEAVTGKLILAYMKDVQDGSRERVLFRNDASLDYMEELKTNGRLARWLMTWESRIRTIIAHVLRILEDKSYAPDTVEMARINHAWEWLCMEFDTWGVRENAFGKMICAWMEKRQR